MLTLGPSLLTALHLECTVCDRHILADRAQEDAIEIAFSGAVPYAVCPSCQQIAHRSLMRDPEYRRKARVYVFERYGHVLPT